MSETNTVQWEIEQWVKSRLFPDELSVLHSVLYRAQPEIRRQMVIRAYTTLFPPTLSHRRAGNQ